MNKFVSKKNFLYFDNAASTPPFIETKKAVDSFISTYGSIHRGFGMLSRLSTNAYENARNEIIELTNAKDCDLIFVANSTDGINLFAQSIDRCVVANSNYEHSSNYLPWRNNHDIYQIDWGKDFYLTPKSLENQIAGKKIDWLAIAGSSNITGYTIDIKEIYKVCKKHGIKLFIDASQYAAHFKIDMDYCDALVFSGHKIYAPYGSAALIVKKGILPSSLSSKERTGGGNISYFTDDFINYKNSPHSREVGTPNGAGAIAIAKSLSILHNIGWDLIHKSDVKKTLQIVNSLNELDYLDVIFPDLKIISNNHDIITPVIVFKVKDQYLSQFREYISLQNIGLREGSFCAYKILENKLGVTPLTDFENENLEKHLEKISVFRLSPGLITDEKQVEKCIRIFKGFNHE